MNKIRFIIQTTRSCFRTWHNTPRVCILLGMIACFAIIYAVPFADNAKAMGETLHVTEIFIALLNWRFSMLLFSTSILFLYGDLPVTESLTQSALIKGSRAGWIVGQIIYVVIASFLILLFVFIVSVLVCFPNIHYSDEWSKPVKLLVQNGRIAISPERMRLPFQKSIVQDYSPWSAFIHCFSLFFLMSCFYGLSSIALRMLIKSASFILLMIVNAVSWATGMFSIDMKAYAVLSILSVHYHASLYEHGYGRANPLLPTLTMSYAVLIGLIVLLIVISLMLVRRHDFSQMEVEHV